MGVGRGTAVGAVKLQAVSEMMVSRVLKKVLSRYVLRIMLSIELG
jgi:hypothetical protein